jgi:hypothetical protein
MSNQKQLTQEEVAEMRTDLKNNAKKRDKYTFAMFRSDVCATWRGFVTVARWTSEAVTGISAGITLWAAYKYVQSTAYPKPIIYSMTFAVVLIALIFARIAGRYLIAKGRK